MNDIRIPVGLCDVTYNDVTYQSLASEAVFEVAPSYQTVKVGALGKMYLLEDYEVSLTIALTEESYNTLKLSNPALKDYKGGLYDNPALVNQQGKRLIIHPVNAGNSKEYDITIFNAIIDPENGFTRTYQKGVDMINVRFIGQPGKSINENVFQSFYFIGDTAEAGV